MYGYKITLERAANTQGELRGEPAERLEFTAENHDDLFNIVRRQRAKGIWDEDTAAQLAVGLKLFTEVSLHHRNDPLFAPLMPAMREFIGRLKALPAAGSAGTPAPGTADGTS